MTQVNKEAQPDPHPYLKLGRPFPSVVYSDFWLYKASTAGQHFRSTGISGKWCIICTADEVDAHWNTVKRLLDKGKLHFAKVSTERLRTAREVETHVICVYTTDWENKADVDTCRQVLFAAGFTSELGYKRDIDTISPNPDFEFIYKA